MWFKVTFVKNYCEETKVNRNLDNMIIKDMSVLYDSLNVNDRL